MNRRERVFAAVRGEPVDRLPVSFWGHFYHRESSASDLADATLEFQRTFDWDWVKLNPRKHYHVEPWGVRYAYSGRPNEKPVLESWPVRRAEDWAEITARPADAGAFAEQLEAVRLVRRGLPPDVPLIETVFTPLAVLGEMVKEPKELRDHMRTHPQLVRAALEAVTATYEGFVRQVMAAGVDGLYFATVDWASQDLMSAADLREWARPFDLRVLKAAGEAPLHVLHVCKRRNLLLEMRDYPVAAYSYDATDPTNPPLADALARMPGAFMGGISHEGALQHSDPEAALGEFHAALEITQGRHWLVAPGCSIPPATPAANLRALRAAVDASRPLV
jgi:uroporphyrinogen decarboxylase